MRVLKVKTAGITWDAIRSIVERVSRESYGDNLTIRDYTWDASGHRFTIRAKESGAPGRLGHYDYGSAQWIDDGPNRYGNREGNCAPGARRSWSGRRLTAACWHAHRDVLAAIFAEFPAVRIATSMANYDGADGFAQAYPRTADVNIGLQFWPVYMPALCACPGRGSVTFGTLSADGTLSNVRTIRQADIARCPFYIFDDSHYRADGSCKCNDPAEQARMIRDWDYTAEDFAQ